MNKLIKFNKAHDFIKRLIIKESAMKGKKGVTALRGKIALLEKTLSIHEYHLFSPKLEQRSKEHVEIGKEFYDKRRRLAKIDASYGNPALALNSGVSVTRTDQLLSGNIVAGWQRVSGVEFIQKNKGDREYCRYEHGGIIYWIGYLRDITWRRSWGGWGNASKSRTVKHRLIIRKVVKTGRKTDIIIHDRIIENFRGHWLNRILDEVFTEFEGKSHE